MRDQSSRTQNSTASRTFSRWIPAIVAPIVIGVGVILVPMQATAAVDLPDKTPAELVQFAAESPAQPLSGTIEQRSELGLPDLSGLTGALGGAGGDGSSAPAAASSADLEQLLSLALGSHTARVYLDGPNARLQVLDPLAERNVYRNADGVWIYDSAEKAATHITVDQAAVEALKAELQTGHADAGAGAEMPTPEAMLDQALARLDESTAVTVGTDALVAGRAAYELVLTPRDSGTLVGQISVAIDGQTGTALAASVTARGADTPAFSIAFTDVTFAAPDPAVFAFTPPAGTAVTEKPIPVPTAAELQQAKAEAGSGDAGSVDSAAKPVLHGTGWTTVVELPAGALGAPASGPLDTVTQPVDGGRVLTTSLVTVLFTSDGRAFAGAVDVATLQAAASAPAASSGR
ncbi:LolA family protein [Microterricola pindariensis]|uniref:MucB/RseB N-terminal domain-containing protein n=1 Tax=Microterricola pindariensis TaxID=478010 RepID=A0ABX5AWJ4_9MICO|nr:DUF2092 domain-containing protein [Microterricola pindariensis]PPL18711.1 hypothetical protein GY24_09765 [Microterricola pindariensis]